MEKNRSGNDIIGMRESRFSEEERARMAEENASARNRKRKSIQAQKNSVRKNAGLTKKTAADNNQRKASEKKDIRQNERVASSRNERVRSSTQQRKKDRKRQNNLIIAMLFVFVTALVCVLTATVLRIGTITVSGTENYSDSTVLESAGFDTGDSMVLINTKAIEQKIVTELPFIEKAEIKRVWPDKVAVHLTDAVPALAVDTGKGYILMNNSLKVLTDNAASLGNGVALIRGLTVSEALPGETIVFNGDINTEDFSALTKSLEESGIVGISSYDLTGISNISLIIDHRIEVRLGTFAGASERFAFLREVIKETVESDKKHAILIDVADDGTAYVRNKDDNNVNFSELPLTEEAVTDGEENTTEAEPETTTQASFG